MPDQTAGTGGGQLSDSPDAKEAIQKLKDILAKMETEEGLAKLSKGGLKFEIKPDPGVLWYVAYGT